jgi:peptide deformylase
VPELCYYGDPVLRKTAAPVTAFDDDLRALIERMIEALHEANGVGLAAPQIGVSSRVAVIDTSYDGEEPPRVLVNPEIVSSSEETVVEDEGCLSLPGISLDVKRSARVSVKAQNEKGEEYKIDDASGLLAKALQHEIDHLNGILFIDHVSAVQRGLLRGKLKKISAGEFD